MASFIEGIRTEVSDNWPAFVYIILMIIFSLRFYSERRAETRFLRLLGAELQKSIDTRFDRLEQLVRQMDDLKPVQPQPGRFVRR